MTSPKAGSSDAEFFQQRGFGQKLGFGQRPALLIVDMAKAFANPGMHLGAKLDSQIEAIQLLLRAAHDQGVPVIFSTVSYEDENLKDAGVFGMKQKGSSTLRAGTEGVQIDSRLDFWPTDSLLVKKYASCFFGTDLVSRLLVRGLDTLILTGRTTTGRVP